MLSMWPGWSHAQKSGVAWLSGDWAQNISEDWKWVARPIMRLDENFTEIQNVSIDLSLHRQLAQGWSVSLLDRYWFVSGRSNRNFVWLDVRKKAQMQLLEHEIRHRGQLRLHWAQDLYDQVDADFVRYDHAFVVEMGQLDPFVAVEVFYRIDALVAVQRVRWQIGAWLQPLGKGRLQIAYWREDFTASLGAQDLNILAIRYFFQQ